jgi:endonuclease/exonuclease/phosphatase family metal-dependent hydrolase
MRPVFVLLMTTLPLPALADTTLRVMSYNIWGGGANEGKGIEETLAVIRAANPDVIGLQEVRTEGETCEADYCPPGPDSVGPALAEALGWHYHEQTEENVALWANGVLSRYPITGTAANDLGVSIDVDGTTVWVFNIHHDDSPYQPYQLLDIEYGDAPFIDTAEDAVRFASDTRGPAMELLFAAMDSAAPTGPVFVTGDFNEPSGLDWTEAAAAAGLHPIAVDWPTTGALMAAGFTDAYRAVHPDPVAKPAFTWTPMYPEDATDDHPDRIDFVFVRGATVANAWIVGETGPRSDLAVDPWPSDHRAVLAEVTF